ncbi:uncharacterized protein LOC135241021 isoform X2 [Anguilla rostrata]|uniref:uncharacterized protein LOC135241021 isoform X2 n=1 Tax=Anguilla rostrata TaxID=7938 RepID=UPI0030D168A6
MRMARQQPVGSGFTGEPSTDASAHRFKVQESSDSCGSGNTVMPSPGDPETPVLQNSSLQNDQECLPPTPIVPLHLQVLRRGQSVSQDQEQVPEPSPHHIFKSTDEEVQNIKPPTSNQRVPVMEASYVSVLRPPKVLRHITLLPPPRVLRCITALPPPNNTAFAVEPHSPIDPGSTAKPLSSIDPGFTVEPHSPIEPGFTVQPLSSVDPGSAVEPQSPIEPGLTVEPLSSTDPGSAVEPHSPIDPGFTVEPFSSLDPGFTVELLSTIDPGSTDEPLSPINPGFTVELLSTIDPGSTVEPLCPVDPGFEGEPHSPIDPGVAVVRKPNVDPDFAVEPQSPIDPGIVDEDQCDWVGRVQLTLQRAELKASFVHDEQVQKAWAWARDLRRAGGRPSLPADPASATCMDSSLRISGTAEPLSTSTQCFTLVNGQGEAGAMTEEAEEKQNSLPSMSRVMHEVASRVRPYPLLYTPSYLSRNYSPLQSAPSGWAMQGLGEHSHSRSTSSLPSVPHSTPYTSPDIILHSAPYTSPDIKLHSAPYSSPHNNVHSTSYSSPHINVHSAPHSSPDIKLNSAPYNSSDINLHSAPYSSPHINIHRTSHSSPHIKLDSAPYNSSDIKAQSTCHFSSHTNLHSTPYSSPDINVQSAPCSSPHINVHSAPYNSSDTNLHSTPYSSPDINVHSTSHISSHTNLHSTPYSPPNINVHRAPYSNLSSAPYNTYSCFPCGSPYTTPHPGHLNPLWLYPGTPLQQTRPSALLSSTEMYLKRVLQDIQNTVQNLAQTTFEEVQQMRRSLNVFRTQMMDLELTLMRQHDQVYHHLTQQEREEAEQLQYLRSAVRYQLLQVELQQDERLSLLRQQMRFPRLANLYRHPMGIHGHGLDRLYSASRVPLTEPVSRLLQEQVSLWRDLGSKSAAGSTLSWGVHCSPSSATGPSSTWAHGVCTPERFPMTRTGVFPTSVCLSPTPTTQPTSEKAQEMEYLYLQRERGGAQNPHQWEEMGRRAESFHQWEKREGRAESIHQWEKSGGGAESFLKQEEKGRQPSDNVSSHHGLKEIKDDITDEVHQETVNDLLAVASPRRSHMVTKDSTFSG